jgi:multiple sugar transport system substrate-binding protein
MTRSRRNVLAILAAGAAGSALAACGGKSEPGISLKVDRPVKLISMSNGNPSTTGPDTQQKQYESVFRPANPNVTIEFTASGGSGNDHLTKLISLTVAGTAPDIFYAEQGANMPSLVAKNVLRPVDDLVKADTKFKKEDWFEIHLGAWTYQGKLRGLPWQGGPLVVYYNKDLLTQAGVTMPGEASWTFDAWRDAGAKLRNVMAGGDVMRWPTDVGGQWEHWIFAYGGDVLDKDNKKCVLDSKEALAGIQLMADFIHRDAIAPKPQDMGGRTTPQLFMDKREAIIVMNRQGASTAGFIQPWVAVNYLPKGPAGRWSKGNIDGWGMSALTKEPAAAWEGLKWRTGDEIRREFLRTGNGGVPALKTTANSPEYLNDKLPVEWNKMFTQTMNIIKLAPMIPQYNDISTMVTQVMEQIKRGEVAPASAVKDLVPRVNALLA